MVDDIQKFRRSDQLHLSGYSSFRAIFYLILNILLRTVLKLLFGFDWIVCAYFPEDSYLLRLYLNEICRMLYVDLFSLDMN